MFRFENIKERKLKKEEKVRIEVCNY